MKRLTKLLIVLAIVAVAGFVGVRELRSSCAPAPKADAHGHSHSSSESHANEGFGTKVCEVGLFSAVAQTLGVGAAPSKGGEQHAHNEAENGHDHPPGKDDDGKHDGHKHEAGEADGHKHEAGKDDGHKHEAGKDDGHKHEAGKDDDHKHEAGKDDGHKHEAGKDDDHKHEAGKDDGHKHDEATKEKAGGEGGGEGFVKLNNTQLQAAGIVTAPANAGQLVNEVAVPAWILANANAQAKIVPKLSGTAAKIDKQIGDQVKAGDLLLALESREMAEAKADYLAAWRAEELARSINEREERLWKKKVTAEQDYLNARNAQQSAKIKLDLAHQKLHAIGLDEEGIAALPKLGDETAYRLYEIRSPIDGRVTARDVVLGQIVGTDKEVFTIADLSKVWVELAVPPADLAYVREEQDVKIEVGARTGTAKVIALSPGINPDTRSAKVIAQLDNPNNEWQIGDYAGAKLISSAQDVKMLVPRAAIQTVNGKPAVFVEENGGFRLRPVATGRTDAANIEILSGIEAGETIATTNTFTLKAELGKAEAEHQH